MILASVFLLALAAPHKTLPKATPAAAPDDVVACGQLMQKQAYLVSVDNLKAKNMGPGIPFGKPRPERFSAYAVATLDKGGLMSVGDEKFQKGEMVTVVRAERQDLPPLKKGGQPRVDVTIYVESGRRLMAGIEVEASSCEALSSTWATVFERWLRPGEEK